MTILFHRPTPWSSDISCSTKIYSKLFAKSGHSVIYLQSTINLFHLITRRGYFKTWKEGSRLVDDVWVTCGLSLIPYYDKSKYLSRTLIRLSYKLTVPLLRKSILRAGFGEPDIIWTTVPGSHVLKELFPKSRLIFHCIDNYSAYRGDQIVRIEKEDYFRADHIFVIGKVLEKRVSALMGSTNKITNLGQGVNLAPYLEQYPVPEDLKNIPLPIAIWVGLLKKIDVEYLLEIALAMKKRNGSVVLLGPTVNAIVDLTKKYENIFLLGSKPTDLIPSYLKHSDIGLMPYNRSNQEIYKGQNPLKLYEYAAAKLPIISTWNDEYESLNPPVLIINDTGDAEILLSRVFGNYEKWTEQVFDFVKDRSWESCQRAAEKVIRNL